jgi:hypothetical protein
MKSYQSGKELEIRAGEALRELFDSRLQIKVEKIEFESHVADGRKADILASIDAFGHRHTLVCEVKHDGQPRHVRNAVLQLLDSIGRMNLSAVPVLIAPFLSEKSRAICIDYNVNYLDLYGNAFFQAPGILIDVSVADRPVAEKRDLKSLFRPKAAHILRVMLRNPKRAWRVTELAKAADASLGHVSNVRKALLNREWAKRTSGGVALTDPDALLDAWRSAYRRPDGNMIRFYTSFHGKTFERTVKDVLSACSPQYLATFASFSAARWIAPYGRTGIDYFYANREGAEKIANALKASNVNKGNNVEILILKDRNILQDTFEPVPGVICTSPIQTYLDLSIAGERGEESADYLRRKMLVWH